MIINKELLTLKFLYFFQLATIGTLYIYINPFMSEWGITSTEMALINLVANIFALFSRPFFGYIADKHQMYKHLIIILTISCAVVYSLHMASPKNLKSGYSLDKLYNLNVSSDKILLITDTSQRFHNTCWPDNLSQCRFNDYRSSSVDILLQKTGSNYAYYAPVSKNFSYISFTSLICGNISTNCNETNTQAFKSNQNNEGFTLSAAFWFLGLAKALCFILYSPLVSLIDAVTFMTLGAKNANRYGFTRMFGTIGMLVFSVIIAAILHFANVLKSTNDKSWIYQMQTFSQFTPCFIVTFIIFLVIVVIASFLRTEKSIKTESFLGSLQILYRNCNVSIFFIFVVLGGFVLQLFGEYFYLILYQRYSGLPKYFPGLVTVVMTVSETVFFGLSSYLLKYKNYEIWVSLSFLAWSLRWLCYLYVENFWFLLLTEALHGPSFGLMLASMMAHVSKLGSETTQGRIQGLFSAIYFNIGGALGGLVGGIVLDNFKMFGLFKFMAVLSLLCTIYYPLQVCLVGRLCTPTKKAPEVFECNGHIDSENSQRLLSEEVHV